MYYTSFGPFPQRELFGNAEFSFVFLEFSRNGPRRFRRGPACQLGAAAQRRAAHPMRPRAMASASSRAK